MNSADVMHHSFDGEIDYFVDCIREDRQPHCSIIDGYRSHELCMAIDRSIEWPMRFKPSLAASARPGE